MSVNAAESVANAVETAGESAVNTVTETLKSTSIAPKEENSEADDAHAASAAEGRRLYIGNLAYSTTDEQLKEFFNGFSM